MILLSSAGATSGRVWISDGKHSAPVRKENKAKPAVWHRTIAIPSACFRCSLWEHQTEFSLSLSLRRGSLLSSSGARHYLNHLPVINEAIGGPTNSNSTPSAAFEKSGGMLFQFEADPPTVTMQVKLDCFLRKYGAPGRVSRQAASNHPLRGDFPTKPRGDCAPDWRPHGTRALMPVVISGAVPMDQPCFP